MLHFAVGSLSGSLVAEVVDPSRRALQLQGHITSFQSSISAMERCRYPVIVTTHGVAYGLSVDIIAACDVRYAASNTIFAIKVRISSASCRCQTSWEFGGFGGWGYILRAQKNYEFRVGHERYF